MKTRIETEFKTSARNAVRSIPGKSMKTRIETHLLKRGPVFVEVHSGEIHENKD